MEGAPNFQRARDLTQRDPETAFSFRYQSIEDPNDNRFVKDPTRDNRILIRQIHVTKASPYFKQAQAENDTFRKGSYCPEEVELLVKAVDQFATIHNLDRSDIPSMIKKNKAVDADIYEFIYLKTRLNRTRYQLHTWLRNYYHPGQEKKRAKWTPEEDAQLLQIVSTGNRSWTEIGHQMDRLDVRKRYQILMAKAGQYNTGSYSKEEDDKIKEAVRYKILKNGHPSDWEAVSLAVGTRSAAQCMSRWYDHLVHDIQKCARPTHNDLEKLVTFLLECGGRNEIDIPWKEVPARSIAETWSCPMKALNAKKYWKVLRSRIPKVRVMTFKEALQYALDHIDSLYGVKETGSEDEEEDDVFEYRNENVSDSLGNRTALRTQDTATNVPPKKGSKAKKQSSKKSPTPAKDPRLKFAKKSSLSAEIVEDSDLDDPSEISLPSSVTISAASSPPQNKKKAKKQKSKDSPKEVALPKKRKSNETSLNKRFNVIFHPTSSNEHVVENSPIEEESPSELLMKTVKASKKKQKSQTKKSKEMSNNPEPIPSERPLKKQKLKSEQIVKSKNKPEAHNLESVIPNKTKKHSKKTKSKTNAEPTLVISKSPKQTLDSHSIKKQHSTKQALSVETKSTINTIKRNEFSSPNIDSESEMEYEDIDDILSQRPLTIQRDLSPPNPSSPTFEIIADLEDSVDSDDLVF